MVVDEAGHGLRARRVPHEDDRAVVEAAHPRRARGDAHGDPLRGEEDEVHEEEDEEKRARDEIPAHAENDDREGDASEERGAGHQRDLVFQGTCAAAAIRAGREEETRPDEDDGPHEREVEAELHEAGREEAREKSREKRAPKRIGRGQRGQRDAQVRRVKQGRDRPGLLFQHPAAIPTFRRC